MGEAGPRPGCGAMRDQDGGCIRPQACRRRRGGVRTLHRVSPHMPSVPWVCGLSLARRGGLTLS